MNILSATYEDGNLIMLNQQLIPITSSIKQQLQSSQGQKFDLGIRPEHLQIIDSESTSDDDYYLNLQVDIVEPLGRETLVKASAPDSNLSLNMLAEGNWHGKKGEHLKVKFNPRQLFIFDSNSGKTIISGS